MKWIKSKLHRSRYATITQTVGVFVTDPRNLTERQFTAVTTEEALNYVCRFGCVNESWVPKVCIQIQ